jgi:hypothetical protein
MPSKDGVMGLVGSASAFLIVLWILGVGLGVLGSSVQLLVVAAAVLFLMGMILGRRKI